MSYNLFIDDMRKPHWSECVQTGCDPDLHWLIARSSREAKELVELRGMPDRLALDHDLGFVPGVGDDHIFKFLHWLTRAYWKPGMKIPEYTVHSANPEGVKNIISFMESWKRSEE